MAKEKSKQKKDADDLEDIIDQSKNYLSNLQAQKKFTEEIHKLNKELAGFMQMQAEDAAILNEEEKEELNLNIKLLKLQQTQAENGLKAVKNQIKLNELIEENKDLLDQRVKATKKLNALEDKYKGSVKKGLGFIEDINEKISEIPIVGDLLSKAIGLDKLQEELTDKFTGYIAGALDPAAKKQKEAADAALAGFDAEAKALNNVGDASEESAEKTKAIGGAAKSSLKAMGPLLLIAGAIGAAIALFKSALEIDQEITDLARGLGVSKDQAHEVHHSMLEIASTTKVVGANTKELTAAYTELADITGQSVVNNTKMLETQVLLKKQYGMTAEDASSLQTAAAASGQTTEQQLGAIQQMTSEYNSLTGDSINFKSITKDIAKISKSTLATYKGDVKALTMAAIQAKKLGMSLDDTKQIADNLLDVESGLEAEMKANVLTGKNMNLNKARQLALDGDIAAAAAEAVNQAGDYDEFMKMKPYQQKAIAEAAGMTVDQLTKAGELQKMSVALGGKEIKDMSDLTESERQRLIAAGELSEERANELVMQEQQASVQEKMAQIVDGIKASFISMMDGPIGAIIHGFEALVGNATALKLVLGGVAIAAAAIAIPMAITAISAMSTMSAITLGVGALAIAAGIAVAAAASDDATKSAADTAKAESVQDGMMPGNGAMIKSPKGTYKLADEDTIIAGTELGKPGNGGDVLESLRDMLSKVKDIDEDAIDDLEDLFEDLDDAFDEIDLEDLTSFGNLAGKDLSGVGDSLAAGINSLGSISDEIDLGNLEDAFDDLEDAFDEIDIKDLVGFAGLADKDLSKLGSNIAEGINSLATNITPEMSDQLEAIEDVFDQLEDIISELDLEELDDFMSINFSPLESMAVSLQSGLSALAGISTSDLGDLEDVFEDIEDALDELDMDDLKEFSEIDLGNLAALTGTGEAGSSSATSGGGNNEVASLLKELIAKIEQPLNININGKVIQEMEKQASLSRTYGTKVDGAHGATG